MPIKQKQLRNFLSVLLACCFVNLSAQGTLKREMPLGDEFVKFEYKKDVQSDVANPLLHYTYMTGSSLKTSQGAYDGHLLNGSFTAYSSDKRLLKKGNYKNGLLNGEWLFWNEEGQLDSLVTYKNGIRHGKMIDYSDSSDVETKVYKKGEVKQAIAKSTKRNNQKLKKVEKTEKPEEVLFEEKKEALEEKK